MSEIKMGNSIFTDTLNKIHTDDKGNLTCCGGLMHMTIHMDGKDFYQSNYECECGNCIFVRTKRSKEDMMYWA